MNNVFPLSAEDVLRSLRQLPPRERLHVVAQVLPELERDLPATPSTAEDFWQGADLRVLAERQGIYPVTDFDTLLGGWPADESTDDFLTALREWRRQNQAQDTLE